MKKEEFLQKSKRIHLGYEYDIKDDVLKSHDVIRIRCLKHEVNFEQKVYIHLGGSTGCKGCYTEKIKSKNKLSSDEFIMRSVDKHTNIYDYSKVILIDTKTPVEIICKKHGSFFPTPSNHMNGSKCPKCAIIGKSENQMIQFKEFVERSLDKYENLYEYIEPKVFNYKFPIKAICNKHGIFILNPERHITRGAKCPSCTKEENSISIEEFIKISNNIFKKEYDYSLVSFNTLKDKVKIICQYHGIFYKRATHHIHNKKGCPECSRIKKLSMNISEFIKISDVVFNGKYDYTNSVFINKKTKIEIICPKHGTFMKRPIEHINGSGCPVCRESKGELKIREILNREKIEFISQKIFEGCFYKNLLKFDFYLPNYNLCIEYDGPQHSQVIEAWGGQKKLEETRIKDGIKNNFCSSNNIKLFRINYDQYKNIEEILYKIGLIIKIKNVKNSEKKIIEDKIEKIISMSSITHDFKYSYNIDRDNFKNINSIISVNCPLHGEFNIRAYSHLEYGIGCGNCIESKGKKEIAKFLTKYDINYDRQHKFMDCKNIFQLPFDFYIPSMRTCIEIDSIGQKNIDKIKYNDKIKSEYCEDNYISLIKIRYHQLDDIYKILWDNLKNQIKKTN